MGFSKAKYKQAIVMPSLFRWAVFMLLDKGAQKRNALFPKWCA